MGQPKTDSEKNTEIINLLRIGGSQTEMCAAQRIEDIEAENALMKNQLQKVEDFLQTKILVYHACFPGEDECSFCTINLRGLLFEIIQDVKKRLPAEKLTNEFRMLVLRAFDMAAGDNAEIEFGSDIKYWILCKEMTMQKYISKTEIDTERNDSIG